MPARAELSRSRRGALASRPGVASEPVTQPGFVALRAAALMVVVLVVACFRARADARTSPAEILRSE